MQINLSYEINFHSLSYVVFYLKYNVFQFLGLLKPNYNSVDLTEVEHVDNNSNIVRSADPVVIEVSDILANCYGISTT
jgi:hypothetical protein